MKWLIIIGLLLAGVVGAVEPEPTNEVRYTLNVYGNEDGYFYVLYQWKVPIPEDLAPAVAELNTNLMFYDKTALYRVRSLAEVRPTPQEMEKAGYVEMIAATRGAE